MIMKAMTHDKKTTPLVSPPSPPITPGLAYSNMCNFIVFFFI